MASIIFKGSAAALSERLCWLTIHNQDVPPDSSTPTVKSTRPNKSFFVSAKIPLAI